MEFSGPLYLKAEPEGDYSEEEKMKIFGISPRRAKALGSYSTPSPT